MKNIVTCFLFRIRDLQNGGGVKFVNFQQTFDRRPISTLQLKYCPQIVLKKYQSLKPSDILPICHVTLSYSENRGNSHGGLQPKARRHRFSSVKFLHHRR